MPNFSPFCEGELEALLAHDAAAADLLGLARRRAPLGEEEVGVDTEAVGLVLPTVIARIGRGSNESYMCGPPAVGPAATVPDVVRRDATSTSA